MTRQTAALAALSLSMLLSSLGTSIANVGLPTLARAFGATFHQVQWVVLAYLLAITAFSVGAGRLGDGFGPRRLLLAGITLFVAGSLVGGLASALWILIAARVVQGLGAAAMMALAMALAGKLAVKGRAGHAMGLLGTMSALGTALGPSLGGVLIGGLGWRSIFLVCVPLGVTAFALVWRYLPADQPANRVGGLSLGLLRDPVLRAALVASTLVSTVMMATLVVGPFHLARGLGLDTVLVGLAMSAGPVVAALTGVPAGRLVDRHGVERMARIGLIILLAGSVFLSLAPVGLGIAGYVVPLVMMTAGYALFQTANNTGAMALAGAERRGLVSGLLNLSRNLGLVAGAAVMGALFALATGAPDVAQADPASVVAGTKATFMVAALVILLALGLVIRRRR